MTAEIAILNRHAVVLAADSATTVTSWKDGEQEQRYFKGANKLFELSRAEPVGLMIYGSAGLQGVPWEIGVKAFREELGAETHDHLEGYAKHFFEFIEDHDKLFTPAQREAKLISIIGAATWRLENLVISMLGMSFEESVGADIDAFTAAIEAAVDLVGQIPYDGLVTEADVAAAIANFSTAFENAAPEHVGFFVGREDRAHLVPAFCRALVELSIKEFRKYADTTGIVVAGYGKHDYYPSLEVYECYGFLGERLIFDRIADKSRQMDSDAAAVVEPFATTSMIDTFRFGVAPDAFGSVYETTRSALDAFARDVMTECQAGAPIDDARLSEMVNKAHREHTDVWFQQTRNQHFTPLSNVIHSLPLPDMAALARSLIELESLKERVTKPSESVSGPIDVAVISKYDGFVWIDRKHYFSPDLNPRYMKRFK